MLMTNTARAELAQQVVKVLDVPLNDLLVAPVTPTVAKYRPNVHAAATEQTRANYGRFWKLAVTEFGHLPLDEVKPSNIRILAQAAAEHAVQNGATRVGRGARENCLRAMRHFFERAVEDEWVAKNPAAVIALPRRLANPRFALSNPELADLNDVIASGGNDIALDCLIHRLHVETGCRRGGTVNLREVDTDVQTCLVRLREKFDTERWQPISPTLMRALQEHVQARGLGHRGGALLRYKNGRPLTCRRYDTLWKRVRRALPWAAARGVSAHWLRHTSITWVERNFGYGIARAYAGHTERRDSSTTTYISADVHAAALALSKMTGEPHPLTLASNGAMLPHGVTAFREWP